MKNKKSQQLKVIFVLLLIVFSVSCKTTKNFSGNANLTILIVDQNDRALENYELTLSEFSASTNSNGLCVFYNIPGTDYTISGQKEGYTKIKLQPLSFTSRDELFCYRVFSYDYVLDQAEQLFRKEQYQKALELLQDVCAQSDPLLQNTISFYSAWAYTKLHQKEKAGLELRKIEELEDPAFEASKYCKAIARILLLDY